MIFGIKSLQMTYLADSARINATLAAIFNFDIFNGSRNGSAQSDIRVNIDHDSSADLSLSLWDATSGTEISTVYDPGVDFAWSMTFHDIDGLDTTAHDGVVVKGTNSPDLNLAVRETSPLVIDKSVFDEASVTSGNVLGDCNSGNISSPLGNILADTLTEIPRNATLLVALTNTSTSSFESFALDPTPVTGRASTVGRNLVLDGGDLKIAFEPPFRRQAFCFWPDLARWGSSRAGGANHPPLNRPPAGPRPWRRTDGQAA